ncbi:class C sortase [Halalkalibacillus sediminis]|nr:class C sortase [Halalkalibacillus sediminis]
MKRNLPIILIFSVGLVLLTYPYIARLVNEEVAEAKVFELQESWTELSDKEKVERFEVAERYNDELSARGRLGVELTDIDFTDSDGVEQMATSPSEENGNDDSATNAYSYIEIPRLNLNLPIYLDSSRWSLANGIGLVPGSSMPVGGDSTHSVLAGHRGMATKEMFQHLDRLRVGDEIHIHSVNGKMTYRVYRTDVILPNQTGALEIQPSKDLTTLVTCHPYGSNSHRLIVQGERVD